MKTVVVTVKTGEGEAVEDLVVRLQGRFHVTVFEAPSDLEYAYPFPVVTVSDEDSAVERIFGDEAVCVLKDFADSFYRVSD